MVPARFTRAQNKARCMLLLSFLIAAALPDPASHESIGWFIATAAGAALAYREVSSWVRGTAGKGEPREITNDPLHVRLSTEFISRDEFTRLEGEVHSISERMNTMPEGLAKSSEDRLARVHQRIDELQHEMSAMPDRIVALLRNTGNLK